MRSKIAPEQTAANIARVIELRKAGKTRQQILEITKFQDRFIREHMKGVQVETKPAKRTQLSIAAGQAYALAIRPQGCKDYELRQIAYDVYGTKWDAEEGITTSAYNKDTLYSIKKRVRELAEDQDVITKFVPDWVCEERPQQSRVALETAALELSRRIDDLVSDFLCEYMVDPESDSLSLTTAQAKQRYGARRHILKLAVPEFNLSAEPLTVLLERSHIITDVLEGTQDLPVLQTPIKYFQESPITTESFAEEFEQKDVGGIDPFFDELMRTEDLAVCNTVRSSNTESTQIVYSLIDKPVFPVIEFSTEATTHNLPNIDLDDLFGDIKEYVPHSPDIGDNNATNLFTQC